MPSDNQAAPEYFLTVQEAVDTELGGHNLCVSASPVLQIDVHLAVTGGANSTISTILKVYQRYDIRFTAGGNIAVPREYENFVPDGGTSMRGKMET